MAADSRSIQKNLISYRLTGFALETRFRPYRRLQLSLVLNHLVDPKRALIAEEIVCAALAVLHDVKTSDDR